MPAPWRLAASTTCGQRADNATARPTLLAAAALCAKAVLATARRGVYPYSAEIARRAGVGLAAVGAALSVMQVVYCMSPAVAPRLAAAVGARACVTGCMLAWAALLGAVAAAEGWPLLCVLPFLGAVKGVFDAAWQATITSAVPPPAVAVVAAMVFGSCATDLVFLSFGPWLEEVGGFTLREVAAATLLMGKGCVHCVSVVTWGALARGGADPMRFAAAAVAASVGAYAAAAAASWRVSAASLAAVGAAQMAFEAQIVGLMASTSLAPDLPPGVLEAAGIVAMGTGRAIGTAAAPSLFAAAGVRVIAG
eukprot:gene38236-19498_t